MFKRLRERIAEEGIKFPVGQLANNSGKLLPEPENKPTETNSTEDLITLSDSSSVVVPHTSSQQFSIGEEDGSLSEQSTPQRKQIVTSDGTDAHSAKEHHQAVFADLSFGQEYRPSTKLPYVPQSDIESEREDPPTLNLDYISKDQLQDIIQILKAKSYKYKNKYAEVVKNYKELREDKVKIENTLIENQDKGLRRIAELREQCQLEQKAKAHLEENLRLLLEEKDSRICVLETQINLLKGDKSGNFKMTLQDDCDSQFSDGGNGDTKSEDSTTSMSNDVPVLQEKVERLQHQHNQDKKTITSQRDQISLLRKQNENLSQELESKVNQLNNLENKQVKLKSDHDSVLKNLQDRLIELEKQQEESIMSMAETKKNMHVELELKEKQLVKAEEESKLHQAAAEQDRQCIIDLKKQHEEKVNELLHQLKMTEKTLEDEKQSLLHELGQGKTAAINLMQQECAKKIAAIEEEWKSKCEALEAGSENVSQKQVENLTNALSDTQNELKAANMNVQKLESMVALLEKKNVSLKNSVEKLEAELVLTTANYEKMKISYSDYESLKEKENLFKNQECANKELNSKIKNLKNSEKELQSLYDTLAKQLEEHKNVIINLRNEKSELTEKLKNCEISQSKLESSCDTLKKEILDLNEVLEFKINEIESLTAVNNTKSDEICCLENQLKSIELNEKLAYEKLNMALTEGKEFEVENAELLLKNRLLNDKIENLTNSLLNKENELFSLNKDFSQAYSEIYKLKEILDKKESMLNLSVLNYKQVESFVVSLEKQQACTKQALDDLQIICKLVFKNSKYISQRFEPMKNYFKLNRKESDEICEFSNNSTNIKDMENSNYRKENVAIKPNTSKVEQNFNMHNSDPSNLKVVHVEYKADKWPNNQDLFDKIAVLNKENEALKEELNVCKSFSELQNVEFAKNITILQQSLNDLQEERNNLSLVLQNIENNEIDKINNKIEESTTENNKIERYPDFQHNWEIKIANLNLKVKSEIENLSSQTELADKELSNLQEHFRSNQNAFSEKISVLNSKLLFRTEALINLKEEFDASVENANSLKEMLQNTKQELNELNKSLSAIENSKVELENKCKALKEKCYKRECELKEMHNSQLAELKNQTQFIIDKLNYQVQESNKLLKENEETYKSKLESVEYDYYSLVSYFQNQVENFEKCEAKISYFNDTCNSFEAKIFDCTNKLDNYCSKITKLNYKVNQFLFKLKEKDDVISEQSSTLLKYEDQLKINSEFCKHYNNLQNEFNSLFQMLQSTNKEIEIENNKLKSFVMENIKLNQENEEQFQTNEYLNENSSKGDKPESLFFAASKEIECIKGKYSEICSKLSSCYILLQDIQNRYKSTLTDIDNQNDLINEQKISSEILIATVNEQFNNYQYLISQVEGMNLKFEEHNAKTNQLIDKKQYQLCNILSKFSALNSIFKSSLQEISDLKQGLNASYVDTDNMKVSLEEVIGKLKVSEKFVDQYKFKYENTEYYVTEFYNNIIFHINNMLTKFDNHAAETNKLFERKEIQFKNVKSKFSHLVSEYDSKVQEVSVLKSKLESLFNEFEKTRILLKNEKEKVEISEVTIQEWKSKFENSVSQISDISKSNRESTDELKCLLGKKETELNETRNRLLNMIDVSEKVKLHSTEVSDLQDKLNKNMEDLQNCNKLLHEQNDRISALENEKLELLLKYDTAVQNLSNNANMSVQDKEDIKKLKLELEEKNTLLNSIISYEKWNEFQEYHNSEIEKYKDQVCDLQSELKRILLCVSEKECIIKAVESEKSNMESHHEDSLKCMKEKLQNAEKNYKTQMDEMKLKLNQLEKENNILLSEKENLLVIQNQIKELKNSEMKTQSELNLKEEEVKKLKEKLELLNKEQVEKVHSFQETMKDKENMILKLKATIESLSKEHLGNVDDLHKKIKRLEQEREQLMLQAQERVSATEAKCRDDVKALQEKYDNSVVDNHKIEKFQNQISHLRNELDETLHVVETNKVSANQEILILKDKLTSTEQKLVQMEKIRLTSISEFSTKLEKLQQENKQLLCNNDHVEKLKSEKEELNIKLKNAVQQVNKIKDLESERDHLSAENEKLSKEILYQRTTVNENISMREKLQLLEENESVMKKRLEDLTIKNEQLKSEIMSLKNSLDNERDSMVVEKERLQNKILQLENYVSDPQDASVKDYLESLKKEYEAAIKAKDDDMLSKLKQLVRDFSIQMDVKDKDSEQMITELMEKNQYLEETLQKEHAIQVAALREELFEKDCALEEMRDNYEETIKEKNAKIKKQEFSIKSLSSKETVCASAEVINNATESSDWDDTWVVPDEVVENSSPVHDFKPCEDHTEQIELLQEELSKCNSEIKELKLLLRLSPPDSVVNNNRKDSLQSLPEPTEFEYLKNIIYEYMMGKEPVTLAKVIAAVLRFSDIQTQQVIRREEARHPAVTRWLG